MLLTFKRHYPITLPPYKPMRATNFRLKIEQGIKIHSFRLGRRWKPGNYIHFWEESPRNNGMNPCEFSIIKKYAAHWGKDKKGRSVPLCAGVEWWEMKFNLKEPFESDDFLNIKIGDTSIRTKGELMNIAMADGLSHTMFKYWFYQEAIELQKMKMKLEGSWKARTQIRDQPEWPTQLHMIGDLIHWTTKFYVPSQTWFWNEEKKEAQKNGHGIGAHDLPLIQSECKPDQETPIKIFYT